MADNGRLIRILYKRTSVILSVIRHQNGRMADFRKFSTAEAKIHAKRSPKIYFKDSPDYFKDIFFYFKGSSAALKDSSNALKDIFHLVYTKFSFSVHQIRF